MSFITDLIPEDEHRLIRIRGAIHHVKVSKANQSDNDMASFYVDLVEGEGVDIGVLMRSPVYRKYKDVVDRCPDSCVLVCRVNFRMRFGLVQLYCEEIYEDD